MKILFFYFVCCLTLACSNNVIGQTGAEKTKLAVFVDRFEEAHPQYHSNKITKREGDSLFRIAFFKAPPLDLVQDFPFQLVDILKAEDQRFYVRLEGHPLKMDISFIIIAPVSNTQAKQLIMKEDYFITKINLPFLPVKGFDKPYSLLGGGISKYSIDKEFNQRFVNLGINYTEAEIIACKK